MATMAEVESAPRPPLLHRVTARQLQVADYVLAGAFLLLAVGHGARQAGGFRPGGDVLPSVVWVVSAASMALRRRVPTVALGLMTGAIFLSLGSAVSVVPSTLVAFPMYQVAATRPRHRSLQALAAEVVALTVFAVVGALASRGGSTAGVVVSIAAWFLGDSVRVRRVYVAGLADQAAQRQREVVERAQRSVAEERLQIARELHDVVAHSLSVIAVQSGVGRHVIESNPEQAKVALAAVESTSRAALDELRRMLGVLRRDEQRAALAPAPGLAALPGLVDQVRGAGVPVVLAVDERATAGLSPSAELSVYRIVQEALTNVVKHAGPAEARVEIRRDASALVVEVADTGRGPATPSGSQPGTGSGGHHGIVGMRERVGVFGGTLDARGRPQGGFAVVARLPLERVAAT